MPAKKKANKKPNKKTVKRIEREIKEEDTGWSRITKIHDKDKGIFSLLRRFLNKRLKKRK